MQPNKRNSTARAVLSSTNFISHIGNLYPKDGWMFTLIVILPVHRLEINKRPYMKFSRKKIRLLYSRFSFQTLLPTRNPKEIQIREKYVTPSPKFLKLLPPSCYHKIKLPLHSLPLHREQIPTSSYVGSGGAVGSRHPTSEFEKQYSEKCLYRGVTIPVVVKESGWGGLDIHSEFTSS